MSINSSLRVHSGEPLDQRAVGAGTTWEWKSGEVTGLVRFDTADECLKVYDGAGWRKIVDEFTDDIDAINLTLNQSLITNTMTAGTSVTTPQLTCDLVKKDNGTIRIESGDSDLYFVGTNHWFGTGSGDDNGTMRAGNVIADSVTMSGALTINSTTTPAANDAILFSHGRILSQSGSGTNIMLESYAGYLVLKSGGHLSLEAGGSIYSNGTISNTSDDRLKWAESPIANGLNVINQLQPQVYWKGKELNVEPSETERRHESGFIAQEVEQIPELVHAVSQSDGTYHLDYTQLLAYHVAATQELNTLVGQLNARVAALEASNNSMRV